MSVPNTLHVITGEEVFARIKGNAEACVQTISQAYQTHHRGESVLPRSGFLRLPSDGDRIISLPGYLGAPYNLAGIKWIASVPGNTARGLQRASAVLILNDVSTGYPFACLEASAISAARTAASGVLAAELLAGGRRAVRLGIVGAGRISAEVARFLVELQWQCGEWRIFDKDPAVAEAFGKRLSAHTEATVTPVPEIAQAFIDCDVVVLATVAGAPHVHDAELLAHNPVVIHLSLRDLDADLIAGAQNYTDDAEHAFRENTSLMLAEQKLGHRQFLAGTIQDLMDDAGARDPSRPAIFSPFGLGVLDIALGQWVCDQVIADGGGTAVSAFFAPTMSAL